MPLVMSVWHMPRATANFSSAGITNLIAKPVGFWSGATPDRLG